MLMMMQAAPSGQSGGTMAFLIQMFPLLAVFVIFYLIVMRPQSRRMKEHQNAIAAVKKGDDVITGGGIRGRVTKPRSRSLKVSRFGSSNRRSAAC